MEGNTVQLLVGLFRKLGRMEPPGRTKSGLKNAAEARQKKSVLRRMCFFESTEV